jgi:hypothetical protein
VGRLTGGDPSLLRRINSAVVLHALRATDCATLTEITRVTGLSRPTVEGVVEGLIEAGLVVEKAAEEGAAGRRGGSGSVRRPGICWGWRSGRTGWPRCCPTWTAG